MARMLVMTLSLVLFVWCSRIEAARIINLKPKESKTLTNSSLWTLNATCSMSGGKKSSGTLRIQVLKNKGAINGKSLSSGQSTLLNVANDSQIKVSAEAGTQIHLKNMGADALQAVCGT